MQFQEDPLAEIQVQKVAPVQPQRIPPRPAFHVNIKSDMYIVVLFYQKDEDLCNERPYFLKFKRGRHNPV